MLPTVLPIFPLPNVVLFPDVFLPLHIFEPRYQEMVRAALDGDRFIGMVLLKPTAAPSPGVPPTDADEIAALVEPLDRPAIFPTGCAGVISHVEALDDGKFNIILRGLQKFQVLGEEEMGARRYRTARIEPISDAAIDKADLRAERARLEALLVRSGTENFSFRLPPSMPDVEFVHALSQYFGLEPLERQALLELPDPVARCRALIELIEMQLLMGDQRWNKAH